MIQIEKQNQGKNIFLNSGKFKSLLAGFGQNQHRNLLRHLTPNHLDRLQHRNHISHCRPIHWSLTGAQHRHSKHHHHLIPHLPAPNRHLFIKNLPHPFPSFPRNLRPHPIHQMTPPLLTTNTAIHCSPPTHHFHQHHSIAVHIAPLIHFHRISILRRYVTPRPGYPRQRSHCRPLRHSEIRYPRLHLLVHEYVARLQVPMHDCRLAVVVKVAHSFRYTDRYTIPRPPI
ncbi:hypothetical protein IEQ34_016238 [Dendrobium chrysotoxum]|uniref:Uncharacterized protein n=1 Tax=Dendrobium chrysotoxum TaxID=161865 RepID=A0AAV7GEI3_DENCH|nr:hypothetical protein IEQ34_016238 [Dendrobium chrysotoxum]